MTTPGDSRSPRVFDVSSTTSSEEPADKPLDVGQERTAAPTVPMAAKPRSKAGWLSVLVSALGGLFVLAAGAWFARFVSVLFARDDWLGWTAIVLASIAGLAALMLLLREVVGLVRLGRLADLKKDVDGALRNRDKEAEQRAISQLKKLYAGRPELRWALSRIAEYERDIREPGELLALADRELFVALDTSARQLITATGKRIGTVTALSPLMLVAVVYVAIENLRMLRGLATLYGGRPGGIGALKLARMVFTHIVATGGVAMTDDLLGQFLGQDLLRRLSRRLGEGAFNAALTARIGTAAIEVIRPLPYIEATPVRVRDLVAVLFRRSGGTETGPERRRAT